MTARIAIMGRGCDQPAGGAGPSGSRRDDEEVFSHRRDEEEDVPAHKEPEGSLFACFLAFVSAPSESLS